MVVCLEPKATAFEVYMEHNEKATLKQYPGISDDAVEEKLRWHARVAVA